MTRHLPRLLMLATMIVVVSAASVMASSQSATVTVSMTVPSNVTLTNNCTQAPAHEFGTVLPGTNVLTDTGANICSFDWQSSNDTSMIRVGQRDGIGSAMGTSGLVEDNQVGPNFQGVESVDAFNDQIAMVIGDNGSVDRTQNGGALWQAVDIPASCCANAIAATPGNSSVWWAGGRDQSLYRTADGLAGSPTWTDLSAALNAAGWPATVDIEGISAIDANTALVAGDDTWVAKTSDGGVNWAAYQVAGPALTNDWNDVVFIDASNAFVVGDGGWVAQTTLGGDNAGEWAAQDLGGNLYAVDATAANNVVAVGHKGTAATFNGAVWNYVQSATDADYHFSDVAIDPSTPTTYYAAGDFGTVKRSTDSGVTWSELDFGVGRRLKGIAVPTSTDIFVIADGERYMHSSDGGTTFTTQNAAAGSFEDYIDVAASPINGQQAVAVDDSGGMVRTTDGGTTWAPVASPATAALFDIDFGSDQTAWAVGHGGAILRSTDGGLTWQTQSSGVTTRLYAVDAFDEQTAFAVGTGGVVLRTTNGGASWSLRPTPTTRQLEGVSTFDGTTVIAAGNTSTVLRSTNGGETWVALAPAGLPSLNDSTQIVDAVGGGVWYIEIHSDSSDLWKSTDDGVTWVSIDPPTNVLAFDAVADGVWWFGDAGSDGVFSEDDGVTDIQRSGSGDIYLGVEAIDRNTAYMVGTDNTIRRYDADDSAAALISDYQNGVDDWGSGAGTNMFGVCLQAATGGSTVADWTVDTGNTAGLCEADDGDDWTSVPTAMSKVAHTTASGASGTIELVWGARPSNTQQPGIYTATVAIEAVAPDV